MLLQIRDYINRQGTVSTQQLTREFHIELPALQPMLELWLNKGIIRKCEAPTHCKSACFKCKVSSLEYYQYVA